MPVIINGSTGVSGTDGTAGTPAVQGTDTNTGMFFPAADQIAFAEGGVEAMRLDASGNVGIGTNSPFAGCKLTIAGNLSVAGNSIVGGNTNAFTLNLTGGTTFSTDGAAIALRGSSAGFNNHGMEFYAGGSERARITAVGDFLLGTTSTFGGATAGLQIQNAGEQIRIKNNSNANYWRFVADSSNTVYVVNQSTLGVFIANGGSAWSGLSDERAKDIIEPIQDAANKVSQLRAVIGKYKVDEEGKRRSFLIAQDVQAVLPEAVSIADPETGHLGLAYTEVIPLLTAALQEALTEIAALKARVAALEIPA